MNVYNSFILKYNHIYDYIKNLSFLDNINKFYHDCFDDEDTNEYLVDLRAFTPVPRLSGRALEQRTKNIQNGIRPVLTACEKYKESGRNQNNVGKVATKYLPELLEYVMSRGSSNYNHIINIPVPYTINEVEYAGGGVNAGGLLRTFYDEVGKEFEFPQVTKLVVSKYYDVIPYLECYFEIQGINIEDKHKRLLDFAFFVSLCASSIRASNSFNSEMVLTISNKAKLYKTLSYYYVESLYKNESLKDIDIKINKFLLFKLLNENDKEEFVNFVDIALKLYENRIPNNISESLYLNINIRNKSNIEKKKLIANELYKEYEKHNVFGLTLNKPERSIYNILQYYGYGISDVNNYVVRYYKNHLMELFFYLHCKEKSVSINDKEKIKNIISIEKSIYAPPTAHGLGAELILNHNSTIFIEKCKAIINTFIDSLNDEEIKIFIKFVTGNKQVPQKLTFKIYSHQKASRYLALSAHTCFFTLDVNYNYTGKNNSPIPAEFLTHNAIMDPILTNLYHIFITDKDFHINNMKDNLVFTMA